MKKVIVKEHAPLGSTNTYSKQLFENALRRSDAVLTSSNTQLSGLSALEALSRLQQAGLNTVVKEKHQTVFARFISNVKNPLILLLIVLGIISYITGDFRASIIIFFMVILGVFLRFFQEMRADNAALKLSAMVNSTTTVMRDNKEQSIALSNIVPGDIILLVAGDMVPADVRILSAKDLFLNQSALTGESLPLEKTSSVVLETKDNPLDLSNICFFGSNVQSGSATAVVLFTGAKTYFGSLAASITKDRQATSFDKGINGFTWLMIRFIAIMVPAVFLINGIARHNWIEAFMFALAVAVGLTPEMLPMIVTVNLSKGALAMARKKVIVKRLNSIQNFGAMDVLCTDKTGTLTEGKIVLEKHLDVHGEPSEKVLHFGYLNSFHHTGLKNLLDRAILDHKELKVTTQADTRFRKVDEIPFDFERRRMSVVVEDETGLNTLICKGAVEEVMNLCTHVEVGGNVIEVLPLHDEKRKKLALDLNSEGFRVIALAYKEMPGATDNPVYAVSDEADMILLGFLAFLDPPKESAAEALKRLRSLSVDVKVLTGDNQLVAAYICKQVGIPADTILVGSQIDTLSEELLIKELNTTSVFAQLAPSHKERIIRALQKMGHVVGFLGDGINDAPALKAADVGISVNEAVDIAKESSDIILLENSLLVLEQGVLEGRRVFGNIVKYIKMAASSNFGNMFSMVGASAFLPFIPMLPIQVLTNNLLYDISQTTIPSDNVDDDWVKKPRQWTISKIVRFVLFIGPISSLFDYLTFFVLLYVFDCWHNPALFHTGWFIESLFTQTLIIHIIRTNKIPFIQSRPSLPLIVASILVVGFGAWLTISPLATMLGFVALPATFWLYLALVIPLYALFTQAVKNWFIKRYADT